MATLFTQPPAVTTFIIFATSVTMEHTSKFSLLVTLKEE
jgi:hypothetical protein